MSSNNVYASLLIFDGSNYKRWADRMKLYLQMFNLWGVVEREEENPEGYDAADNTTSVMRLLKTPCS